MTEDSVAALAEAAGLELSYTAFDGSVRQADEAVLRDLAADILPPADKEPVTPPRYVILRQSDALTAAALGIGSLQWQILCGNEIVCDSETAPRAPPPGIYTVRSQKPASEFRLVIAPSQAYQPPVGTGGRRIWLIAVQLYGIRSGRNWGHGDFSDLSDLLRLAASAGAGGVGVNPLHALFPSRPVEASPYSPSSRVFLNPLYIDVTAVPGFPEAEAATWQRELASLRATDLVDYPRVAALKRHALRLAYDRFQTHPPPEQAHDFAAFRESAGPELRRFAVYEVLCERLGTAWRDWPERWRHPDAGAIAALAASAPIDIGFVEFQQWQAHRQLEACRNLAKALQLPLGLYLDFAVGIHPDGFDVWNDPEAFLTEASVGAPPDLLNRGGQDWGLACFNPRTLQARGYEPFRHSLRAAMQFSGAMRFDHILGLNRLYLIPRGRDPRNGAYLRFPIRELLAVMAIESVRHECLVIGEDLGTVPEGLRDILDEWGIWTYLILLFERDEDGGIRPVQDFPARALTAFNTHDMATFAGWWAGEDLEEMRNAGLTLGETPEERETAREALRSALAAAGIRSGDRPDFAAVARLMARSPCGILAIGAEDLVGSSKQPNMPGTWKEYPNWRWRLPVAIEELPHQLGFRAIADAMAEEGRAFVTSGRPDRSSPAPQRDSPAAQARR